MNTQQTLMIFFYLVYNSLLLPMLSRRDEARAGAAYARRVRAAVAAQESRPGAQVVQRLDVAG